MVVFYVNKPFISPATSSCSDAAWLSSPTPLLLTRLTGSRCLPTLLPSGRTSLIQNTSMSAPSSTCSKRSSNHCIAHATVSEA